VVRVTILRLIIQPTNVLIHLTIKDVDLGIRLFQRVYEFEILGSHTMEEATSKTQTWIKPALQVGLKAADVNLSCVI